MVSGEPKSSLISLLLFVLRKPALVSSGNLQRHVLFVLFFNTGNGSVWLTVLLKTLWVRGRLVNWDEVPFCFSHHFLCAMGCLGSHLAPEAAGCQPSNEGCTQLLKDLGFIYIIIFNTTPCPPTWSLDCWRSYCTMRSTSSVCSSRAVKVQQAWRGLSLHWPPRSCQGVRCHPSLSHPGVPAPLVQGAGEALAVLWAFVSTCHRVELRGGCVLHFLRQNKYVSAFWHWFLTKDSRSCSCAGFLIPSPALLQCVLFWNTQFSYKQSTLSTTCFCTFWNGALRQINESKYGSLPVKILQTVSSQGHWLRQHIILFTVETENPFLPIQ